MLLIIFSSMLGLVFPANNNGVATSDCVVSSHDFPMVELDDVDVFGYKDIKNIVRIGGDGSELMQSLGSPQWIKKENRDKVLMKWVHGERRGAEDEFCDKTVRATYLTVFFVMEIAIKDKLIVSCEAYEDGYITQQKVVWNNELKPTIRKKYTCAEYFNVLERR